MRLKHQKLGLQTLILWFLEWSINSFLMQCKINTFVSFYKGIFSFYYFQKYEYTPHIHYKQVSVAYDMIFMRCSWMSYNLFISHFKRSKYFFAFFGLLQPQLLWTTIIIAPGLNNDSKVFDLYHLKPQRSMKRSFLPFMLLSSMPRAVQMTTHCKNLDR